MKTVLTALVTTLIVAGGAGAYVVTVTPSQFAALKRQVGVQGRQEAVLRREVTTLRRQVGALAGTASSLQSDVSSLQTAQQNPSATVTCLQTKWNALTFAPADGFVLNGAKYDSSSAFATQLGNYYLPFYPKAQPLTQC
jgi:hypothetical protein